MTSAWPSLAGTVDALYGLFSLEDTPDADGAEGCVEDLQRVLAFAEQEGLDAEALEHLKQRLEEYAHEGQKELTVKIKNAVNGEVLTTVRARRTDTAACLREGVLRETGDSLVAMRFIFGARVLGDQETLEEAGIADGDCVQLVRSPLQSLTASFDGSLRVCPLRAVVDDDEVTVSEERGPVLAASLAPDGSSVLAVCSGGDASLRCPQTGELICNLSGWAASGEFSADSQYVVGASDGDAARLWCAKTGRCLKVLRGHTDDVRFATFSPDGDLVATASCDGMAAIWEVASGERLCVLSGHADVVRSVAFSPDCARVLTSSMDATARIWEVSSGSCVQVLTGHTKALSCSQFSSDGQRALTASFDGTVRIWDATSGECAHILPAENSVVNSAMFSPDGSKVLVASASESLRLFCASTGECRLTLSGHEDWVRVASFSPDGMLITSGSYDGTARIWSALDGQCVRLLEGHSGAVVAASISAA